MATIDFGYTISKPRAIDIDRNNLRKSDEILREMPDLRHYGRNGRSWSLFRRKICYIY